MSASAPTRLQNRRTPPLGMADMPVQLPANPTGAAESRARFFNSGNAFNIKLPPVPARLFTEEPARSLASDAATGFVACDQSAAFDCAFPATTPLMLARYATIRPDETLPADRDATGSIWYAIRGGGTVETAGEQFLWSAGDVFLLPGGSAVLSAGPDGAVLWTVGNDPQLAFDGASPPPTDDALIQPVHYPAAEIGRQIDLIYEAVPGETTSGLALIFSSDRLQESRNILPTLTLSFNTLPPDSHQRAHRHNAAAITLVVAGQNSYSTIDGERCPWTPWATMVTPPGAAHSHHNGGGTRALFLIVQDGGLHYHARTMGFSFLE